MQFLDEILIFFTQSPWAVFWQLVAMFLWVIVAWGILHVLFWYLMIYKAGKFTSDWKFVVLAIDIPQLNVQTPLAVEQLFTHIFAVMEPPSIGNVYRRGFVQQFFSFEIVSIEGYIQFLIRTREKFRDVVEMAVYAQYPEAEITEVEDYVNSIPDDYPNDTHQVYAMDFAYVNHWINPIRVYREFEHNIAKDTVLKDPIGTFLESMTRIGPGEQVWFQIIVEPIQEKRWKHEGIREVEKLIGAKKKAKPSKFAFVTDNFITKEIGAGFAEINAQLSGSPAGEAAAAAKDEKKDLNDLLYLTPGQKKQVEAMEEKLRKLGFRTKIRLVYAARKEIYNPSRAVNSIVGAMNQYTIPTSNALLPKYLTSTQYAFAKRRKEFRRRVLVKAYKNRDMYAGKNPYIMSIEELATIWHFPMSHVKTPLVQKAISKIAEPPAALPVENLLQNAMVPPTEDGGESSSLDTSGTFVTDTGEEMHFD